MDSCSPVPLWCTSHQGCDLSITLPTFCASQQNFRMGISSVNVTVCTEHFLLSEEGLQLPEERSGFPGNICLDRNDELYRRAASSVYSKCCAPGIPMEITPWCKITCLTPPSTTLWKRKKLSPKWKHTYIK
ncbi:hypothetical protein Q5P01_023628 [Channa striata]|uniref:Uncharacterized protein n=1 Tax=Channa striata TaxID=64152 RepID=A0AA88LKF0_CHASR|nr:hypothetical protein Q5P01_023628 [Channa striata]